MWQSMRRSRGSTMPHLVRYCGPFCGGVAGWSSLLGSFSLLRRTAKRSGKPSATTSASATRSSRPIAASMAALSSTLLSIFSSQFDEQPWVARRMQNLEGNAINRGNNQLGPNNRTALIKIIKAGARHRTLPLAAVVRTPSIPVSRAGQWAANGHHTSYRYRRA
jgi:hypothetical protein